MKEQVRTAIFPVAGLGTRFLPATKATPKELLPVLDTPLIQFAIDEAQEAGIERMIFVSHPSKSAIERHVLDDAELRAKLKERGKAAIADDLAEASLCPRSDDVVFTMQEEPLGLGHAIAGAKDFVLPGAVAVLLPDDLILHQNCLQEMISAYSDTPAGHLVATMTVPQDDTKKYGILNVTKEDGPLLSASGMVEKPDPAKAPSREAVVGRYVLDASIFDDLVRQTPGAGGEIQLTDAITAGTPRVGLAGFRFSGTRFDCGSKAGMFDAALHLASRDPELRVVLDGYAKPSVAQHAA